MAASALPETLKSITAIKIQELNRQRDEFESAKAAIYVRASSAKEPVSAAQALLDGTRKLKNVHFIDDDSSDDETYRSVRSTASQLANKHKLLRQAAVDPSVQPSIVSDIHESLKRELELESVRHKHAQFFSELVTEWLSNPDSETQVSESTTFEEVGRKEMHEQRATWESLVFKESNVDTARLEAYLKDLFTSVKATNLAYENLMKQNKTFSSTLWDSQNFFDSESLKGTMKGLLNTDLLSEEKNATIKTFMTNKEVLSEVVDVLNMRYVSLSSWQWSASGKGIPVEMRRQLNGKYRVFMDEDVLDAILLYEIGLKWSVQLKNTFRQFFNSFAWKRNEKVIPKEDRERREFFLENDRNSGSETVQSVRRRIYSTDYFMTQLPTDEKAGKRNYDDDDSDEESPNAKSPLELKHGLLHLLVAESLLAKEISPSTTHTVIRSDFKWFGPGLPHETIYTILKFFGVSDEWLSFFRKFLEVPLFFVQDGPNAEVHRRKRGVPMSHTLSDVFGESVLFVMDFAVNQATSSYLYRLHDDFWLWGSEDTCLRGWRAMTKFASTVGIEFNEEKTGTVRFEEAPSSDSSDMDLSDDETSAYGPQTKSLPKGEVRWGFLRLDAASGRFLVDQSQVDEHIKELQTQLSYCKSIFSYIQSYNAYAGRFFTNNFGKPSYGFGQEHVNMIIETFSRIQKVLFPSGSVTDHLASLASQRFQMTSLPQGFWYFPIDQGGVGLLNPLIPLLGMRGSLRQSPARMLQKTRKEDEAEYYLAELHFKDHGGTTGFGKRNINREILKAGETFMPMEEYLRYREERSRHLGTLYSKFLEVPSTQEMEVTADLNAVLSQGSPDLPGGSGKAGILANFVGMQPYWKWIIALYGQEIVDVYGSVRMVDGGQVPLGVVSLMKKGKVRWRG